jgi:hypothetical protein
MSLLESLCYCYCVLCALQVPEGGWQCPACARAAGAPTEGGDAAASNAARGDAQQQEQQEQQQEQQEGQQQRQGQRVQQLAGIPLPPSLARHSGVADVRALLDASQRLRSSEYFAPRGEGCVEQSTPGGIGAGAGGRSSGGAGGGEGGGGEAHWRAPERLSLLQLLCELLCETQRVRAYMDGAGERRRVARKGIADVRAKVGRGGAR